MDEQELLEKLEELQSNLERKAENLVELLEGVDLEAPTAESLQGKRVAYALLAELAKVRNQPSQAYLHDQLVELIKLADLVKLYGASGYIRAVLKERV